MTKGQVKWFSDEKGYGFIEVDGSEDVFVHYSDIVVGENEYPTLFDGDRVELEIVPDRKGPRARHVNVFKRNNFIPCNLRTSEEVFAAKCRFSIPEGVSSSEKEKEKEILNYVLPKSYLKETILVLVGIALGYSLFFLRN